MSSHIEKEILKYKESLEKALLSTDSNIEIILDILKELVNLKITINLLRKTKIGQTLQDIKKKYNGNEVGLLSKQVISKWKKDCENENTVDSKDKVISSNNVQSTKSTSSNIVNNNKINNSSNSNNEEEIIDDSHYESLPPIRKNIMGIIVDCFKMNTNESIAKVLAYNVEYSINKIHSADTDQKAYLNKAKSLAFNLKKNEQLRLDIMEGNLQAEHLAYMNTSELAGDDLRKVREEAAKNAMLARRGDLYEITRAEILSANGIDPNKGGEFTCRKCKGTKTTHYALQTRSSDEPMTVFVGCLTCGNRWRCT